MPKQSEKCQFNVEAVVLIAFGILSFVASFTISYPAFAAADQGAAIVLLGMGAARALAGENQ